jgi:hypothetical protein
MPYCHPKGREALREAPDRWDHARMSRALRTVLGGVWAWPG